MTMLTETPAHQPSAMQPRADIRLPGTKAAGSEATFAETDNSALIADTGKLPSGINTSTKAALLGRAKEAIQAGEQSLHDAAEALAVAQELHSASQAEMARAIGKSEAWVSYLLQWRRSGYKEASPFGPRTKAARLKHAEDRAAPGASQPRTPRNVSTEVQPHTDDPEASAAKRRAEYAKLEAETEMTLAAEADISALQKSFPAEAKSNLIGALDQWWPCLDDAGKRQVIDHLLDKAEAWSPLPRPLLAWLCTRPARIAVT
jgi:hypothetical protein